MHLFDNLDSGNGYKARLLLAQLGKRYDWTDLDIDAGDAQAGVPEAQSQRAHPDAHSVIPEPNAGSTLFSFG
jgi:hypothetical protein